MKIISTCFIVFVISLFYYHNGFAQESKTIEFSMVTGKLVDTVIISAVHTYRITKDSVSEEIYEDGKIFLKKAFKNNPAAFTSEVLEFDLSAWENLEYKSRVLKRCDTLPPLMITYNNAGKKYFFSISNTGPDCFPDDIKIFANKVFGLFKED